ncbi:hypothetical protein AMATHDRAFT_68601 [Amanita thiersii Skay4041]|uniref:Uncharacterized protein n=1 Tax=Amanita thiersii Skay4041 TaxID=703135 RepID=A0A2A9N910_9AGAR|nr:hypothetical protein AMATHDRAFT_68601 [Amanita thiersii Skay4041]
MYGTYYDALRPPLPRQPTNDSWSNQKNPGTHGWGIPSYEFRVSRIGSGDERFGRDVFFGPLLNDTRYVYKIVLEH